MNKAVVIGIIIAIIIGGTFVAMSVSSTESSVSKLPIVEPPAEPIVTGKNHVVNLQESMDFSTGP